jgi:hypothetical protein
VWTEQRTVDGSRYYWNELKNMSKWDLTAAERKTLVPDLNPYDNDLAMPLLVGLTHMCDGCHVCLNCAAALQMCVASC